MGRDLRPPLHARGHALDLLESNPQRCSLVPCRGRAPQRDACRPGPSAVCSTHRRRLPGTPPSACEAPAPPDGPEWSTTPAADTPGRALARTRGQERGRRRGLQAGHRGEPTGLSTAWQPEAGARLAGGPPPGRAVRGLGHGVGRGGRSAPEQADQCAQALPCPAGPAGARRCRAGRPLLLCLLGGRLSAGTGERSREAVASTAAGGRAVRPPRGPGGAGGPLEQAQATRVDGRGHLCGVASSIHVRARRGRVLQRGCRIRVVRVATTLWAAQTCTTEALAGLSRARWHAALDWRAIKQTMPMDVLRCQTLALVQQESWGHRLVYPLL